MSKRYGRNQRRKHRESIEALKQDSERLGNANLRLMSEVGDQALTIRRLKQHIKRWDAEIVEVLGDMSGFLSEPAQMAVKTLLREVNIHKRFSFDLAPSGQYIEMEDSFKRMFLDIFEVFTTDDEMLARSHIRVVQTKGDGGMGYSIAHEIDDDLTLTIRDLDIIADMITRKIKAFLNKKFGKA